jgi:peroxiredoxin Q/BCP
LIDFASISREHIKIYLFLGDDYMTVENFNSCALLGTSGFKGKLSDYLGQWVVLYFYPKDATPGCTQEGIEFSELHPQFLELNAHVFGISRDSVSSHEKFKDKQGFKVDLISDADETLCKVFDVIKEKNMYGKKVFGIERSTFLMDTKGHVVHEWRKVKVPGHAKEVLDTLKNLMKA